MDREQFVPTFLNKGRNSRPSHLLLKGFYSKPKPQQNNTNLPDCEEKLRIILDYTYNLEYWISPAGDFLYMSPSCQNITGYTVEEFKKNPGLLIDITHPDDRQLLIEHTNTQFKCNHPVHLTFRIITKSGVLRWIAHSCQPAYDSQGNFVGRRASDRNITHRIKTEELLAKSEERFRLALDASSDGVWDRNLNTKEVYHGENWHRVLGYSDEEAPGLTWESLIHADDKGKTLRKVRNHLDGKEDRFEAEFRLRNKAGDWQWVLSRGRVIERDDEGKAIRITGTQTDITQLKEMEIELKNTQDQLEEKVKERTLELSEANIALKVLLKKRSQDKKLLEQQILANLKGLIDPYMEQLKLSDLDTKQRMVLGIIETNLEELTSPFIHNFTSQFIKLTPAEIKVANLVKQGKRTKDIAEILYLSPSTIAIYRKNIRKKLGLTNRKVNLQTALSSYQDSQTHF